MIVRIRDLHSRNRAEVDIMISDIDHVPKPRRRNGVLGTDARWAGLFVHLKSFNTSKPHSGQADPQDISDSSDAGVASHLKRSARLKEGANDHRAKCEPKVLKTFQADAETSHNSNANYSNRYVRQVTKVAKPTNTSCIPFSPGSGAPGAARGASCRWTA